MAYIVRVQESQLYVKTSLWLRILMGELFIYSHRMKAGYLTISPEGRNQALRKLRSYSSKKKELACVHRVVRLRSSRFSLIPNVIKWLYCVDVWIWLKPALELVNKLELSGNQSQPVVGVELEMGYVCEFTIKSLVVALCCYWSDTICNHQRRENYTHMAK